jgi:site-specific DNA recombinase
MQSPPSPSFRAALYARVSTDEQRQGQTIDSQVEELRQFVVQKSWRLASLYKDEGWSGSILGRPALDHLRDDASKGFFDVVIVNDVDRLARDVTHLGVIKRDLAHHGVTLVFRKLPSDNSPTNNLLVNILGSFAEFERELITDRTRRGRRHKIETRQQFLGCIGAYGFRYVPRQRSVSGEGELQILPGEARIVKDMYRWVDREGLSARQVIARLNDQKTPPRKRHGLWQRSSALRILRSETYAGVWHYNKHETRGSHGDMSMATTRPRRSTRLRGRSEWLPVRLPQHLHIINRTQWDRVQRQLDRNIAFSPRHSKHNYLLRGLVKCGGCSAPYVGDPSHGRFYYRCWRRCRHYPTILEEVLNETVWRALIAVVLNPDVITRQLAAVLERRRTRTRESANSGPELDRDFEDFVRKETRLIDAYRTGILPAAVLGHELEKIAARRSGLEARRVNTPSTHEDLSETLPESVAEFLQAAALRLPTLTQPDRQRFLQLLIRQVTFEGQRIKIVGRIPTAGGATDPPPIRTDPPLEDKDRRHALTEKPPSLTAVSCRIVPIELASHGRNSVIEFELTVALDRTRPQRPRDAKTGRFAA